MKIIFLIICLMVLCPILYAWLPTLINKSRAAKRARPDHGKTIYLTFDDGPSREYTPELLDLLDAEGVKASFFVVGDFAQNNPDIIERMHDEGHDIGLHSKSHTSAYLMGPSRTRTDLSKGIEQLTDIVGHVDFYRPPWGHFNWVSSKAAREMGLKTVLWDVMAEDWQASAQVQTIADKLRDRVGPGSTICLHDGRGRAGAPARTIQALREVIPEWKQQGYKFETVSKLYS